MESITGVGRCTGLPPLALLAVLALVLSGAGCVVKRTIKVQVSSKILAAKTASFAELITLVNDYAAKTRSLSSTTMRVTFRSGKFESGKLQEYRSAPGYILLRRPDSLRMSVQNPLTKTSVLDLTSTGDDFSLWIPSDNKFYSGKNSIKDLEIEGESEGPRFAARPIHIFQAILFPKLSLGDPGLHVAMEEAQDAVSKYYVLSEYKDDGDSRLLPVRKYWIDRAELSIVRQQTYDSAGELTSTINYADPETIDGVLLPRLIRIERILDGYSLDLEFKDWRLNPEFPENAFMLTPPPGAVRIHLKEREEGKEP